VDLTLLITIGNKVLMVGWVIESHSGCRFCCSHSRQADRDLAMNLTLPLRSITSIRRYLPAPGFFPPDLSIDFVSGLLILEFAWLLSGWARV